MAGDIGGGAIRLFIGGCCCCSFSSCADDENNNDDEEKDGWVDLTFVVGVVEKERVGGTMNPKMARVENILMVYCVWDLSFF